MLCFRAIVRSSRAKVFDLMIWLNHGTGISMQLVFKSIIALFICLFSLCTWNPCSKASIAFCATRFAWFGMDQNLMMFPGSLFVWGSDSDYLKMFISSNYAFEVYIDERRTQLYCFSDSTIARFYQNDQNSRWIKISWECQDLY